MPWPETHRGIFDPYHFQQLPRTRISIRNPGTDHRFPLPSKPNRRWLAESSRRFLLPLSASKRLDHMDFSSSGGVEEKDEKEEEIEKKEKKARKKEKKKK
jgi:hypothetical protein